MNLHDEAITPDLKRLLIRLMAIKELNPFRLVGGTALALIYGHRSSVDIDMFAGGYVDTGKLPEILKTNFGDDFRLNISMQNGISGTVENIKVDIFDWKVPFAEDPILSDGIRIASPPDIFAYKCEAIMSRRSEKDFCDLGLLIEHFGLEILIPVFQKRYPFISTGAIFPILLKEEGIIRDNSILFHQNNSFEKYALVIKEKLKGYEQGILDEKAKANEERIQKIKALVAKKKNEKPF
jgi:Nucleotidyl transferase AbiEii toxin, Type IV TA system